ncbi:MAG TPA: DUF488 domain-containing protein [Candidatus Paceibacterota bacterium]|nr:DUF488 domain-containing protein [Candidatus Paceibacterota bacterium]
MAPRTSARPEIYTIGHSNRTFEDFLALLEAHGIEQVADVRTVPKSRYNPQFEEERLAASLSEHGIRYERIETLGGFRRARKDSVNTGWRNASFRGYADYMGTDGFAAGIAELEALGTARRSAFMCAEALPWRCHRSLIADALTMRGWRVLDIMSLSSATPHRLTPFLRVEKGVLIYPAPEEPRA